MNDSMWEVPVGLDADFEIEVLDKDGEPVVFVGDEPFTAQLWQGDDLAPVAGVLSATWTDGDPANGVFVASILGTATAEMTEDYFLTRVAITMASGRLYAAYDGWLHLTDAPGAAEPPVTYCSLQDMLDVGGEWLAGLMASGGRTSFLADRARATRELNKVILSRSRPLARGESERMLTLQTFSPEQPDQYLADLLADGALVLDADVKEAVAYLAAHYVCERAMTWDQNDPHRQRAAYYFARWRTLMRCLNVGVDTNDDGTADWYFNLAVMSSR